MSDGTLQRGITRRTFIKSAATLAMAQSARELSFGKSPGRGALAYVGTYTGAVGAGSNGEGIYLFEMNADSGTLSGRRLVAKTPNPSWIAIHPSHKYLLAVNEVSDYLGNSGSVSAFAIDTATGDLRPLNTVSSEGAGPAYLSIDESGRFAFVGNYAGGSIAVIPIGTDGSLGAAVDVHHSNASIGSVHATNATQGSFAISGHDAPHAHMIMPAPQNKFVLATDLGQDRIYVYRLDLHTGKLTPAESAPYFSLSSGDGPRHFAFHPNGKWFYTIQEEASTVMFFDFDSSSGSLTGQQTISTLPAGFAGTSFAADILISSDGRFLYATNRLHDTIAIFSIGSSGKLERVGETSTMGDYPSQCRISPDSSFLFACNRRSDCITSFKVNSATGMLIFTGQYTPVGSPGSIVFMPR